MGGMRRAEPALIVMVEDASFRILTGSENGAELLLRLYQAAFELAAAETGYSVETMTNAIFELFRERAEEAGEGWLESDPSSTRGRRRMWTAGRIRAVDADLRSSNE